VTYTPEIFAFAYAANNAHDFFATKVAQALLIAPPARLKCVPSVD
jgi:hypothetical protein